MIGDKLASAMQLYGNPSCINTAKALQTAAEKGVDIEAHKINSVTKSQISHHLEVLQS